MREHKSLASLGKAHGLQPNEQYYQLAHSSEVYHHMLVKIAGKAVLQSGEILDVLAEKARDGHTRSAEIYLDFVRKTLTDSHLIQTVTPPQQLKDTLEKISEGAEEMLQIAQTLTNKEEIDRYMEAVEADYEDETVTTQVSNGSIPE